MKELPENQKTPLGLKNRIEKLPSSEKVLHNPLLVSLRHQNGRRRHIHCISVDVLENRIGVTFRGANDRSRYLTEWFDRKFWHLITGDEQKAYYQKKEEFRELVKDQEYQERVAKREARDARRARRLGVNSPEDLEALKQRRHLRRQEIAREVNAQAQASPPVSTPVEVPPAVKPEEVAPPPAPLDPDALTQAEEAALNGPVRPFPEQRVGNLDTELPNEYNAMLHMKKDRYPFGDPEKLVIFDALVTSEAVKQEAIRKIMQRKKALEMRQAVEKGDAVWTTGGS